MYSLRWIGGNEQPDIFSYAFSTARFSPKGANRGHYSNARLDALLDDAAASSDGTHRRADYVEAQQILARDLPAINYGIETRLWSITRASGTLFPRPREVIHFGDGGTRAIARIV